MKSEIIGDGTSAPEVLNVSPHGFWLMVSGREYFSEFWRLSVVSLGHAGPIIQSGIAS